MTMNGFQKVVRTFAVPISIFLMINRNLAYGLYGASLNVPIEDSQKECFYQDVEKPIVYKVDWRVIGMSQGGNNDIDFSIEKPDGTKELDLKRTKHGTYTLDTVPGTYTMCLSNEFSTFSHKEVYFSFRPKDIDSLAMEAGQKVFAKAETSMEMSFENLHANLSRVSDIQLDYRQKAGLHQNFASHLNYCIQLMSIAVAAAVLVIGAGQVLVLRLFFTETYASVRESVRNATHTEYIDPTGL